MKKFLLLLLAVLLLTAGCRQSSDTAADAEITPGAYRLDIAAEGWQQPTPNLWVAVDGDQVLTDVRLWVRRLADCSSEQAAAILQGEGYEYTNNEDFSKQEYGVVFVVKIYPEQADCWLVHYSYPSEAEEWAAVLAELADSFELSE